jgi:pSer/pThr/pTyr-binding forkhead associated (FHA) protein
MIICPNCQHKEMSGAIYCSKCGAQLIDMPIETQKINTETRQEISGDGRIQPQLTTSIQDLVQRSRTGRSALADRSNSAALVGTTIVPDVDLTPHNAYGSGVSRLHAVLKMIQEKVFIMDLGSSNGTFLNGKRLSPYVETAVNHGDVVYLGKLKMQVLVE